MTDNSFLAWSLLIATILFAKMMYTVHFFDTYFELKKMNE